MGDNSNIKIGVFQDIHANLPAFKKALEIFEKNKCKKIFHVGDLIGIGPYPKEVFELANKIENLTMIMGNHDYWFAFGIPNPRPFLMSKEELKHQKWNHAQIGNDNRIIAQKWNFVEEFKIYENKKLTFIHYGYDKKLNWFKDYIPHVNRDKLDTLFEGINSEFIFYGHNHAPSDLTSNSRYVNLGSAGCHDKAEVRVGILTVKDNKIELEKITQPYNDDGLMEAFELRKVPAREFIMQKFITRK